MTKKCKMKNMKMKSSEIKIQKYKKGKSHIPDRKLKHENIYFDSSLS